MTSLGKILHNVLTLGTYPVSALFAFNAIKILISDGFSIAWFIPQLMGFVISLIAVCLLLTLVSVALYFAVVTGSDFATRFVEGRAVGTLGIILATVGVVLETFQLLGLG